MLDPEFWDTDSEDRDAKCMEELHDIIDKMLPEADADKARAQYSSFMAKEGLFGAQGRASRAASVLPAHQWWEMYGVGVKELQKVAVRVLSQVGCELSLCSGWCCDAPLLALQLQVAHTTPAAHTPTPRVLQVSSASASERNWSSYDYIHNKKRNKLKPSRARDLVYVFTNQKLLDKRNRANNEEAFAGWSTEEEQSSEEGGANEEIELLSD